ncbi:hypothetical protein [Burkholderia multivorans]|uniref:hypothetical protein n=2 Tax=Burkholderia multivorans TaxID=87883 RepID=UPI000DABAE7E|nr:hypothetical protein [Burkholderia multivorans]RAA53762.1 hypothetical protein DN479_31005 [Burkholderia multivorans]RAA70677.1 hypothetical protein DN468_31130 [Burkholderia multivorans]RAA93174.1 hypothetical protein DN533_31135 [Burkholderia multivorans]RAD03860.1 hypothetical protein DN496_30980 [Burkholderia multivorans]RAD79750.1 hypothetical protein DN508_31920 [Burkholderia multivorans]
MADLNKLNSRRKPAATPAAEAVSVRPSTRAGDGEKTKQVIVRLSEDDRRRLKQRVLEEDTTIQAVLEGFVKSYITGEADHG